MGHWSSLHLNEEALLFCILRDFCPPYNSHVTTGYYFLAFFSLGINLRWMPGSVLCLSFHGSRREEWGESVSGPSLLQLCLISRRCFSTQEASVLVWFFSVVSDPSFSSSLLCLALFFFCLTQRTDFICPLSKWQAMELLPNDRILILFPCLKTSTELPLDLRTKSKHLSIRKTPCDLGFKNIFSHTFPHAATFQP